MVCIIIKKWHKLCWISSFDKNFAVLLMCRNENRQWRLKNTGPCLMKWGIETKFFFHFIPWHRPKKEPYISNHFKFELICMICKMWFYFFLLSFLHILLNRDKNWHNASSDAAVQQLDRVNELWKTFTCDRPECNCQDCQVMRIYHCNTSAYSNQTW